MLGSIIPTSAVGGKPAGSGGDRIGASGSHDAVAIAFAAVSIEVANCPVEDSVGGLVDDALDTRIDIARELRRGAGTRERECHRHEYRSKAQV